MRGCAAEREAVLHERGNEILHAKWSRQTISYGVSYFSSLFPAFINNENTLDRFTLVFLFFFLASGPLRRLDTLDYMGLCLLPVQLYTPPIRHVSFLLIPFMAFNDGQPVVYIYIYIRNCWHARFFCFLVCFFFCAWCIYF